MQLLTILTLIWLAVLVLALAASLLAILIYLRRIGSSLSDARDALASVRDQTRPLEGPLRQVRDAAEAADQELRQARERLVRADDLLAAIADRLGAGALRR